MSWVQAVGDSLSHHVRRSSGGSTGCDLVVGCHILGCRPVSTRAVDISGFVSGSSAVCRYMSSLVLLSHLIVLRSFTYGGGMVFRVILPAL